VNSLQGIPVISSAEYATENDFCSSIDGTATTNCFNAGSALSPVAVLSALFVLLGLLL